MRMLKNNKEIKILLTAFFGLLVVVGLNPTSAFADSIKTIPSGTPTVRNPNDFQREGTIKPNIQIIVTDNDLIDSVGGDIYILNDRDEVVAEDKYSKKNNVRYSQYHYLEIPLDALSVGKNTFKLKIVNHNLDYTMTGESVVDSVKYFV